MTERLLQYIEGLKYFPVGLNNTTYLEAEDEHLTGPQVLGAGNEPSCGEQDGQGCLSAVGSF
jgi:hypothetical protein